MNAPDRAAWIAERSTGIGGSEIASILGLSKWQTPLEVYQRKRGEIGEQPDNPSMRWGRLLEPTVRQAYSDETGRIVKLPSGMLRHPKHPHMIANLDGFVEDRTGRVYEGKTARSSDGWGEAGSDEIPLAYLLQVQHYMEVTALPVADVAVLIGGSDFRIYTVEADRELAEMIVHACFEFWARVQRGDPPEPVSYADLQARFGRLSRQGAVLATPEVEEALRHLRNLQAQAKEAEKSEEKWRSVVMKHLGDNDTLIDADGRTLATWMANEAPKRFDAKAFRGAHPALAAEFTTAGIASRRFLIK